MPMNPMMRAHMNNVKIPGMPKPPGMSSSKEPVKAERVQRSEMPKKKRTAKEKGRIT